MGVPPSYWRSKTGGGVQRPSLRSLLRRDISEPRARFPVTTSIRDMAVALQVTWFS